MYSTFITTMTGLSAYREQLSVISNNIANSETTAYKTEGVTFAEIFNNSLSAVSSGSGVSVQDIASDFTQGSLETTGSSTDLAITGSGLFIVRDAFGSTYYTRDGAFEYDADKVLVTADGLFVQGYSINSDGSLGALGNIELDSSIFPATATTEMTAKLNLNSATDTDGTFSMTVDIYDSLGNEIPVTITFTKSSTANEWDWSASIPSESGTAAGSGTLTFDSSGDLQSGTDPQITLTISNGANTPQTVAWDLYDSEGNSNGDLTQYSLDSSLSATSQNGNAAGELESISIDENGVISGSFSNGETKELFQIALATFANFDGLNQTGNNLYAETPSSGNPVIGAAGSEQFGSITCGSLEASNVDIATDMANMILAQRAYEACAKMFTTESEVLETTISMVR